MKPPALLVPLDGTEGALVAIPVAKRLAEIERAALHLLHVSPGAVSPDALLERAGLTPAAVRGSIVRAKSGEPPDGILDAARELEPRLIVLCTHTAKSGVAKTIGRTALAVLMRAPCPVVLVRPERGAIPWDLRRILLPHDGTPTTSAAIAPAARLARDAGAALDVLHVASAGARPPEERGSLTSPRYVDQPQHEWPAWTGEFLERLASVSPLESLQVHVSLAHGRPGEEVLRFATERGSDLVVLAWRGTWEGEHAATAKTVVRDAGCPVMVIRA